MPNQERTFTARGKRYVLRFTQNALCRFERALGKSIPELDDNLGAAELQLMLWAGLEGARIKSASRAKPFSIEDAAVILSDLGGASEAARIVIDALRSALPGGDSQERRESGAATTHATQNWDQLLADGMELGLKPDEFWNMTPREFAMYAAAQARRVHNEIQRSLALAWNIAALARAAPLPPLSQILETPGTADLSENHLAERREEFEELTAKMLANGRSNG
jgi:hypothetical protein